MAEHRVVIKLNYDKDKRRKELIDPKMVTVWHTGRIFSAIAILVAVVVLISYWVSGEDKPENNPPKQESVNQVTSVPKEEFKPTVIAKKAESEHAEEKIIFSKRPPAIIFDRRVIRASLNTAPRNGEPGDPIKPRVIIGQDQSIELFYFSEIKNMKDKVLFHHWLKNGALAYKKRFTVETNKLKLISSKKLSQKDAGEWRVALIDNKGKRYSEVNFFINP